MTACSLGIPMVLMSRSRLGFSPSRSFTSETRGSGTHKRCSAINNGSDDWHLPFKIGREEWHYRVHGKTIRMWIQPAAACDLSAAAITGAKQFWSCASEAGSQRQHQPQPSH
jgi:hypothetical protein